MPPDPMRPDALFPLFAELTGLPGVGPKNLKLFEKIAGSRVKDLLMHAPAGLVDRSPRETVVGAPEGAVVTVEVEVGKHHSQPRASARPYKIEVQDAGVDFLLVYFRGDGDYLRRLLPSGTRRIVSGKIELYDGVYQMPHPDHVVPLEEAESVPRIEPVYPLTAGLSLRILSKVTAAALDTIPELPEWLDAALVSREKWPSWATAIRALHHPQGPRDLEGGAPVRRRLAYDEFLSHQIALGLARARAQRGKGEPTVGDGRLRARVLAALPYAPTGAQSRALSEIERDMGSELRMMRLLQGDVGSGKTLVALLSMLIAIEAGGQAALMAPTEILARQHMAGLAELAESVGVTLEILTGRDKGRAREDKLERLAAGEIDVLIGTHALFQKDIGFRDLRLAVIDEQHRFGVAQRMALAEKGTADVLVMTATPIPRTLALAQYGDMDVSVLDEKPPGRQPIETRLFSLDRLEEMVAAVGRALEGGARAYWVCPLVEDSEVSDLAAAEARYRALSAVLGPERVALVHGRMTPAEKDEAMARFVSGAAQLLVATTVIEVGVNVPEATVIVIEHAERFGLAQLHQLRGRVGRGSAKSHCFLLYQGPLTEAGRARLSIMRESEDGFRLAEEDLRLRGAGDLLGVKQSGLPAFRIADAETQTDLMQIAHDDARLVLARDPELSSERGRALRMLLHLTDRDEAVKFLAAG
ncbi:MAG: ATP-dependent DNA helicase RecG [Pseudomonadota bacterium]